MSIDELLLSLRLFLKQSFPFTKVPNVCGSGGPVDLRIDSDGYTSGKCFPSRKQICNGSIVYIDLLQV